MNQTVEMNPIGVVHNQCDDPAQATAMRQQTSELVMDDRWAGGLQGVQEHAYIDVLFWFHKAPDASKTLRVRPPAGGERGVFATRSPKRPNGIGVTTVELLGRRGNRLQVRGLDAVNGTPVLDIKPCDTSRQERAIHASVLKAQPRLLVHRYIMAGDTQSLLLMAGALHGHFCPGLAMGVMAGAYAMRELGVVAAQRAKGEKAQAGSGGGSEGTGGLVHGGGSEGTGGLAHGGGSEGTGGSAHGGSQTLSATGSEVDMAAGSDGLEDLLVIAETNNCLADGIQLVTGCSFGNNSLIFYDLGKVAFTLTRRDGRGVRVCARADAPEYIRSCLPGFDAHYTQVVGGTERGTEQVERFKSSGTERAFGTLELDFDRLFEVSWVRVQVPDYAPSHESRVCVQCGEQVMQSRTIDAADGVRCLVCANKPVGILDGHGLRETNDI